MFEDVCRMFEGVCRMFEGVCRKFEGVCRVYFVGGRPHTSGDVEICQSFLPLIGSVHVDHHDVQQLQKFASL